MLFLKLIRWKNLLIILLTELIIKYALIDFFLSKAGLEYRMSSMLFIFLVFSSIFIAAAGYIINDIEDIEIDRVNSINRPLVNGKFSIKFAKVLMYSFNILGVIFAFLSAFLIKNPSLASFQLLIMALLYGYSVQYKCKKLLGNIIVSITTASVPLLIWIYTIYDILAKSIMFTYELRWMHISIAFFIFFAFTTNIIRELIKDKEDTRADKSKNCITWAGSVETRKFKSLVILLAIIFTLFLIIYQITFPFSIYYKAVFSIIVLVLLFYTLPLIIRARGSKDYRKLSNIIKMIMIIGILAPLLLYA